MHPRCFSCCGGEEGARYVTPDLSCKKSRAVFSNYRGRFVFTLLFVYILRVLDFIKSHMEKKEGWPPWSSNTILAPLENLQIQYLLQLIEHEQIKHLSTALNFLLNFITVISRY